MVRFFCTRCQKVKRVQQLPPQTQNPHSTLPTDRLGECRRHSYVPRLPTVRPVETGSVFKPAATHKPSKKAQREARSRA
jgi:hypothetical protein